MADPIDQLTTLFERFPGIGPRQAGRFVQYLLRTSPSTRYELAQAITQLSGSVHRCGECERFFAGTARLCAICASPKRSPHTLAIVASDADLASLERSGEYTGYYYVIGGTIHLANEKADHLRLRELRALLPQRIQKGLTEVILALPANPEGDATAVRIRDEIIDIIGSDTLRITTLGRGLSTGSELEYADPETLKSAIKNRR